MPEEVGATVLMVKRWAEGYGVKAGGGKVRRSCRKTEGGRLSLVSPSGGC